jgi:hypothetical protein
MGHCEWSERGRGAPPSASTVRLVTLAPRPMRIETGISMLAAHSGGKRGMSVWPSNYCQVTMPMAPVGHRVEIVEQCSDDLKPRTDSTATCLDCRWLGLSRGGRAQPSVTRARTFRGRTGSRTVRAIPPPRRRTSLRTTGGIESSAH